MIISRDGSPKMLTTLLNASKTWLLSTISEAVSYRLPAD